MRIKLINLNVWHGGWRLWDNIISYLAEEQPDIIMLQEVYATEEENAEPYLKTLSSLQAALGLPYSAIGLEFILKTDKEKGPMGNGVLSKFPLDKKPPVWLQGTKILEVDDRNPQTLSNFPRNILHCKTLINGQAYHLMTLHGVWAPDGNETELQKAMGQKISKYIHARPNVILSGDFNVGENSHSIRLLEQDLNNIFKSERVSSFNMQHKTNPGYATAVVDFVFASSDIKVLEHYTSEADVSDHQSQVVIFDL